jgi:hypothetical protein
MFGVWCVNRILRRVPHDSDNSAATLFAAADENCKSR